MISCCGIMKMLYFLSLHYLYYSAWVSEFTGLNGGMKWTEMVECNGLEWWNGLDWNTVMEVPAH